MNKYIISGIILLCVIVNASAVESAKEAPIFQLPVSARATALGNAVYCSGYDGVRYNPAYLGEKNLSYLYGTYGMLARNKKYSGFYGVTSAWKLGIGFGVTDLRSEYDTYAGPDTEIAEKAVVAETVVSVAVGKQIGKFVAGAAVRGLFDQIAGEVNSGYLVDLGCGYAVNDTLKTGLTIKNALSINKQEEDRQSIKGILSAQWYPGFKFNGQKSVQDNQLHVAVQKDADSNVSFAAGWESTVFDYVALRAGYDRNALTAGIGIKYRLINFDVAMSMKKQDTLSFITIGYRFGGYTNDEIVDYSEKDLQSLKSFIADKTQEKKENDTTRLINEGWTAYREAKFANALSKFNNAVLVTPGDPRAVEGQKAAQKEIEALRKQEGFAQFMAEGSEAFKNKEYVKAEQSYRYAIMAEPGNASAVEGVRLTIEEADREMGRYLEGGTTEQFGHGALTKREALEISDTGTFPNMVASLNYIKEKKIKEAYSEWIKVRPENNQLVKKYQSSLHKLRKDEIDLSLNEASRLASQGYYYFAVNEMNKNMILMGLTPEEETSIRDQAKTYEARGIKTSETSLVDAEKMMNDKNYSEALEKIRTSIRTGYNVQEAMHLMSMMKGDINKLNREGRTYDKGLLKKYEDKASDLFADEKFKECRIYLIKILEIEPNNADALRYLDRVDNYIRQGAVK